MYYFLRSYRLITKFRLTRFSKTIVIIFLTNILTTSVLLSNQVYANNNSILANKTQMSEQNNIVFTNSNSVVTQKSLSYLEFESLLPMFFLKGYHFSVGYRFDKFRIRASMIYSGEYDAEDSGINNNSDKFGRYYDHGSSGLFFGYFPFENKWLSGIHTYVYVENHLWKIENKKNNQTGRIQTIDVGPGVGYQFKIFKNFYIQPAYHVYFRSSQSTIVGGEKYTIPNVDHTIVFRAGIRFKL